MPGSDDSTVPVSTIALFPLGLVLVPGRVMPLHIFEPRYRALMADLLALPEEEQVFGVVAIREGHEVGEDAVRSLFTVGCTARLIQCDGGDDGTYDILTTGERRFRLLGVDTVSRPYATAAVSWLDDVDADDDALVGTVVAEAFEQYRLAQARGGVGVPAPDPMPGEPDVLSYLVTSAMVLDLSERQSMLELDVTGERLRALLRTLRRETALAAVLPSIPAGDLARTITSPN